MKGFEKSRKTWKMNAPPTPNKRQNGRRIKTAQTFVICVNAFFFSLRFPSLRRFDRALIAMHSLALNRLPFRSSFLSDSLAFDSFRFSSNIRSKCGEKCRWRRTARLPLLVQCSSQVKKRNEKRREENVDDQEFTSFSFSFSFALARIRRLHFVLCTNRQMHDRLRDEDDDDDDGFSVFGERE